MISRRFFGMGLTALGLELSWQRRAEATTALGLSLEQLVARSRRVVVGVALDANSSWETVAGTRRIVTTTRVLQHTNWLEDEENSDEILVATLGGRVGDLAQKVPGEAQLRVDEPCLLFVGDEEDLRRPVVAMGQGHYPIDDDDQLKVLRRSPSIPHLIGKRSAVDAPARKQRAVDLLSGKDLNEARSLIRGAR